VNQVDAVCFTGSVPTGRKVAVAAAERFIPAFLELGGKDAAIVLPSADLDAATDAILRSSAMASGQVCLALERAYVHESVYEPFVDLLVRKSEQIRLNYPDILQGDLGPLIFERQADIIDAHLDDAVRKGAVIRCGGKTENLGGGRYCRATVVTNVTHDMALMTEETFGPVTPVMSFRTVDEAVALANDSEYGLSGAVFAGTTEEAIEVAKRINAGGMSINDASLTRRQARKTRTVRHTRRTEVGTGCAFTPGARTARCHRRDGGAATPRVYPLRSAAPAAASPSGRISLAPAARSR
jgi:aldehyde dehydrogenase (NAD+)